MPKAAAAITNRATTLRLKRQRSPVITMDDAGENPLKFNDVIRSEQELRALMGDPIAPPVVEKTLSALDRHCRAFIERSPFVLIASSSADGRMDVSPKGDAPGFVKVLDEHTLVIPDRPGNQRFDTFRNLLESPRVGLIFLIPGKRETLRIGGSAEVVRDAGLLATLAANGKVPALAIAVHVDDAFFHCSKCMIRSQLWQPDRWPPLDGLPTLAQTMKDAASIPAPVEVIEGLIKADDESRLY
ncbi:MAG: MSMEG_1061 family FMN-dependent PPOX-type flavoprotein [Vicinamibacterales bacterium]